MSLTYRFSLSAKIRRLKKKKLGQLSVRSGKSEGSESIGVPSILRVIRNVSDLPRMLSTFDLRCEENTSNCWTPKKSWYDVVTIVGHPEKTMYDVFSISFLNVAPQKKPGPVLSQLSQTGKPGPETGTGTGGRTCGLVLVLLNQAVYCLSSELLTYTGLSG